MNKMNPSRTKSRAGFARAQSAYLKLTEEGPLLVKGHVLYDGKKTDVEELPIDVKPQPTEPVPEPKIIQKPKDLPGFPYEFIIPGVSVGAILLWWIRRRT